MPIGIKKNLKNYWHANTSSAGNLSLGIDFEGNFSKEQKEKVLASAIEQCKDQMEKDPKKEINSSLLPSLVILIFLITFPVLFFYAIRLIKENINDLQDISPLKQSSFKKN